MGCPNNNLPLFGTLNFTVYAVKSNYSKNGFFMAPIIIIIICGLLILTPIYAASVAKPPLMLAKTTELFSIPDKVSQYIVSEKLDGMRAFWNGHKLVTKQGHDINAPEWFTENFPTTPLDGELWLHRNAFEKLISVVTKNEPIDNEWLDVKYMLFDTPENNFNFAQRLKLLELTIAEVDKPWLQLIPHHRFDTFNQLNDFFQDTVKQGAEGLILNHVEGLYLAGRQSSVLKLKPFYDAEAIVIAHISGEGKFSGMMGSLLVQNDNGKKFKIGTGFSKSERLNPPQINDVITYKYHGLTNSGKPKFASFLRIREKRE